jgi:hypothetical protein
MTTAAHLLPDSTDLVRSLLASGERLAVALEREVASISRILGVCPVCRLEIRRQCQCPPQEEERRMNRCPMNVWNAIKKAAALLETQRIRYVLIGTAALAAQGIDVEVPDADLLVEEAPLDLVSDDYVGEPSGDATSVLVDGVKVDYIDATDDDIAGAKYLDELAPMVEGVRVATVAVVMAIKKDASRPKDVAHAAALESQLRSIA